MTDLYTALLRPLLFGLDAEQAHRLTFTLARRLPFLVPGVPEALRQRLPREVFGLRFPNPIGLAAGMDKNGELLPLWQRMGFGFVEVGTVTPRPQLGNPRPRLFRLPKDQALLNRMGFNNEGAEAVARRLTRRPANLIVGINLGKNKDTPNDEAHHDYRRAFEVLHDLADYAVINVSSPNTPGLRALQEKEALLRILEAVQARNLARSKPLPLLLKVAPELTEAQLDEVVTVIRETQASGLIATNTLAPTPEVLATLRTPAHVVAALGAGGLSGALLQHHSPQMVRHIARQGVAVVGVGGVMDGASAQAHLKAGASLVQVYTGLVYRGPGLVRELLQSLPL